MKNDFKIMVLLGLLLCIFLPVSEFYARESSNENSVEEQIKQGTNIGPGYETRAYREAYIRNTARQRYTYSTGRWGPLFNITYRQVWFQNSITPEGYVVTPNYYYNNYREILVRFLYTIR